jgi:hypothetical protein
MNYDLIQSSEAHEIEIGFINNQRIDISTQDI